MKLLKWAFLALTLSTLGLSSCKKSNVPVKQVIQTMSFKFNGTTYNLNSRSISAELDQGSMTLFGSNGGTLDLGIYFSDGLKVGTIGIENNPYSNAFFTNDSSDVFKSDVGTLTVTSINPTSSDTGNISGTFQFTCTDSEGNQGAVTDGQFEVNYTGKFTGN